MWLWLGQGAEKQLVQVWAMASRIGPTVVKALVPMPSPGRILDWHALGGVRKVLVAQCEGNLSHCVCCEIRIVFAVHKWAVGSRSCCFGGSGTPLHEFPTNCHWTTTPSITTSRRNFSVIQSSLWKWCLSVLLCRAIRIQCLVRRCYWVDTKPANTTTTTTVLWIP